MPKEVFITKSPPRYVLNVAGVTLPELTHEDVEHLINVLMLEFPGVSGALREVWRERERAVGRIYQLYKAENGQVVRGDKRLVVKLAGGTIKHEGDLRTILSVAQDHGIDRVMQTQDDYVSLNAAQEEAKRQIVSLFLEKHGLTVDQLLEKIKLGEITEITL